jgi:LemA protein
LTSKNTPVHFDYENNVLSKTLIRFAPNTNATVIGLSVTKPSSTFRGNKTNMGTGSVWLIIGAACVVALYLWYATIITRRNKVQEALSSVDVHLNQRYDLIPNIVSLAARYMTHERALLTEVTRLREEARKTTPTTPTALGKRFALEGELGQRVGQLLVSLEAYPELKADRPVIEAQQTWIEIEAQITASRRFYNAAVNQLNNAIQIFPGPIIAGIAGVAAMPFFEAPAAARAAPTVEGILGPTP